MNNNEIEFQDMKLALSAINCDMAYTYGNVTALVTELVKRYFPNNFFKDVHIDQEVALRRFQNIRNKMDLKRMKPFLSIQSKFNIDPTAYNNDMIRRLFTQSLYDLLRPDYYDHKFFKDLKNNIYIDYSVESAQMDYSFKIFVSEQYTQLNVVTQVRNTIPFGHPFDLPVTMEIVIPPVVIKHISDDSEIPIKDDKGSVQPFLDYLNTISKEPITYKLETSKGAYNFFIVMDNTLRLRFENLDMDEGDTVGQTKDNFGVSFTANAQFKYPSSFYYISKNKIEEDPKFDIRGDLSGDTNTLELYFSFGNELIPEEMEDGKVKLSSATFKISKIDEEVDIKEILPSNLVECVNGLKDKIDYKQIIDIFMYKDSLCCDESDYEFTEDLKIKFSNGDPNAYYKVVVYVDNLVYNDYVIRNTKQYS